jgi:hypothetical protein
MKPGNRKGQSFIIGAMVFSLLVTLVFISTGSTLRNADTSTRDFFSQTLDESSNAFNDALEDGKSADHLRRRMQSYDRFVERQALSRGIDYSTYSLVVVPDRGEAAFFNAFPGTLEVSLRTEGNWKNRTVGPGQGLSTTFSPGQVSVNLVVENRDESYELEASSPRLVKHSVMTASDEKWENTLVG